MRRLVWMIASSDGISFMSIQLHLFLFTICPDSSICFKSLREKIFVRRWKDEISQVMTSYCLSTLNFFVSRRKLHVINNKKEDWERKRGSPVQAVKVMLKLGKKVGLSTSKRRAWCNCWIHSCFSPLLVSYKTSMSVFPFPKNHALFLLFCFPSSTLFHIDFWSQEST